MRSERNAGTLSAFYGGVVQRAISCYDVPMLYGTVEVHTDPQPRSPKPRPN